MSKRKPFNAPKKSNDEDESSREESDHSGFKRSAKPRNRDDRPWSERKATSRPWKRSGPQRGKSGEGRFRKDRRNEKGDRADPFQSKRSDRVGKHPSKKQRDQRPFKKRPSQDSAFAEKKRNRGFSSKEKRNHRPWKDSSNGNRQSDSRRTRDRSRSESLPPDKFTAGSPKLHRKGQNRFRAQAYDKGDQGFRSRKTNPRESRYRRPSRTLEVLADSWTPRGEASYMQDERRLLIWEGIVGEKATVEIKHAGNNQDYAHFQSAEKPHEWRREAPCKHFMKCGGCPLMHIKPPHQPTAKLQILRQALEVEFLSEHLPAEMIVGPLEDYRHQFKLTVGATRDRGNITIGVRSRQGYVSPIADCIVITPELKKLMKKIAHAVVREGGKGEILPYTEDNPIGLRHIVARQSQDSGEILVVFVVTHFRRVYEELADWLIDADLGVSGVALHFNREPGNAIFTRDDRGWIDHDVLRGSHVIEEEINGIRYNVGVGDFFQVNTGIAARLQTDLVAASKRFQGFPMVDLYCGVGFFSLALSEAHGHVYGVEFLAGAVERARENASLNGFKARFFSDDVADGLPRLHDMLRRKRPFVVVDPARRGLEEGVIDEIIALNPAGIAYISCNPRTFARDVKQFLEHGFTFDSMKAYDMIPQSAHVEQFAILLPPDSTENGRPKLPKRRVVV